MLEKYQRMLEDLKKQSRGQAILSRMQSTLKIMKEKKKSIHQPTTDNV